MIIVLIGYMGSGKSIVGRQLASILNCDFKDLDGIIESRENMAVSEIFEKKGEIYFRKSETDQLKEVISNAKQLVLALGGGTPCYGANMELILDNDNCLAVYLKTGISTLVSRLWSEKSKRPLIAHLENREDMDEFIGKHLFERMPYYNKADLIITTDELSVDEIVEKIVLQLF